MYVISELVISIVDGRTMEKSNGTFSLLKPNKLCFRLSFFYLKPQVKNNSIEISDAIFVGEFSFLLSKYHWPFNDEITT